VNLNLARSIQYCIIIIYLSNRNKSEVDRITLHGKYQQRIMSETLSTFGQILPVLCFVNEKSMGFMQHLMCRTYIQQLGYGMRIVVCKIAYVFGKLLQSTRLFSQSGYHIISRLSESLSQFVQFLVFFLILFRQFDVQSF